MSVSHVNSELTVFKSGDELVSETWWFESTQRYQVPIGSRRPEWLVQ
jgi:predicted FMN-binding regulatory protein PaiB